MNDIIMEVMAKQMTAKQGAEEKPEDTSEDPIKKNSENKVEMLTNEEATEVCCVWDNVKSPTSAVAALAMLELLADLWELGGGCILGVFV